MCNSTGGFWGGGGVPYFIAPHSYIPPGSGLGTRRLTLTYHFLKYSIHLVQCYLIVACILLKWLSIFFRTFSAVLSSTVDIYFITGVHHLAATSQLKAHNFKMQNTRNHMQAHNITIHVATSNTKLPNVIRDLFNQIKINWQLRKIATSYGNLSCYLKLRNLTFTICFATIGQDCEWGFLFFVFCFFFCFWGGIICLSVCLWTTLLNKLCTDYNETLWRGPR